MTLLIDDSMVAGERIIYISGLKLAAMRAKAFHTQESLAQKAKISLNTIKRIEPLDRSGIFVNTIRSLATALEETPESLLAEIRVDAPPPRYLQNPARLPEPSKDPHFLGGKNALQLKALRKEYQSALAAIEDALEQMEKAKRDAKK